jgi:hypothetical protein
VVQGGLENATPKMETYTSIDSNSFGGRPRNTLCLQARRLVLQPWRAPEVCSKSMQNQCKISAILPNANKFKLDMSNTNSDTNPNTNNYLSNTNSTHSRRSSLKDRTRP